MAVLIPELEAAPQWSFFLPLFACRRRRCHHSSPVLAGIMLERFLHTSTFSLFPQNNLIFSLISPLMFGEDFPYKTAQLQMQHSLNISLKSLLCWSTYETLDKSCTACLHSKMNVLKDFPTTWLCLPATSSCRAHSKLRGGETILILWWWQRAIEASSIIHESGERNNAASLRGAVSHRSRLNGLQLAQWGTRSSVFLSTPTCCWHLPKGSAAAGCSVGTSLLPLEHMAKEQIQTSLSFWSAQSGKRGKQTSAVLRSRRSRIRTDE